ncbi:MAG: DUF5658 family protein [Marinisporobacter sp.]|jgi:hypothetical protein|nr:DUF5658 family protein [Marinisporobacter sp.]
MKNAKPLVLTSQFSTNVLLSILFFLMIGDYLLTYVGMYTLGIVEEANALMVWLMALPFKKGFLIRMFVSLGPICLFKFAEKYKDPYIYRRILLIPLFIQLVPYIGHVLWVFKYFIDYSTFINKFIQ